MKLTSILVLATSLAATDRLCAQASPPPSATTTVPATAVPFEPLPTLNASTILQPQFLKGSNFTVRDPVPTYSGSNQYTIDSDFGVFTASGDQMLLRRVAEINGIAKLQAMSQTKEFTDAAAQAAQVPIKVAQDLVTDPVETISSVPRGIWGFVNHVGNEVKQATDGQGNGAGGGNAVANMSGFSKTKRGLALKLGVDPYCNNEVFQKELSKVAWPAFLGKFSVDLGMAAVSGGAGTALSAANWTATLQDSLRDKSSADLRQMNLNFLTNNMGIASKAANAFVNNGAISPTTQTLIVASLRQLGNIPGQGEFILHAAGSQSEHDALAYQQSVQIMANLSNTSPIVRIIAFEGLTVCQTKDGTVAIPIQWDYVAWTPGVSQFIAALKARKFPTPPNGYTLAINGVASPTATQALQGLGVNLMTKALPGPLQ